MRFKQILILVLALVFVPIVANAAVLYQAGTSVTLGWDDEQTNIEYYEVVLVRDVTGVVYGPYPASTKTIVIQRPKSGIFEVKVRGVVKAVWPYTITWNPPVEGAETIIGYKVLVWDNVTCLYAPDIDVGNVLEYVLQLTSGVQYYIKVKGYHADGTETGVSGPIIITPDYLFSEWCSSLDDTARLETGVLGKWKVFFKLMGPTGPIIIY